MVEPSFNRLVKLVARAFYDDITTKSENQPKNGRSDNKGIAVVVLDALTRHQWVREEDLAKDLKLHAKQLRRILRFLEEEKLVTRDHRKETAKGAKIYNAAVSVMGDGQQSGREGDDKQKMHTQSYCCLDYAQMYDVVRYRLYRMKKKLKDELESKNTIQEYICPSCNRRYTALDALRLVSPLDDYFHCECCNSVLAAESDKLTAQDLGDGDDNVRRRRHENLKNMLAKMEEQLKPLNDQLARVRDLTAPYFGNLQAWELKANAARRSGNGDINPNDPSKSSQGFDFGGTPMPFIGQTKVEVAFSDMDQKDESITASTQRKRLPPWMIREGMVLHEEQRGESKVESKMGDETLATADNKDDKKSASSNDDAKNIQDEYIKAYYAALLKMHNEQQEAVKKEAEVHNTTASPGGRQIGMKSKRDENPEGDDNEWEDAPAGETTRPFNLNVEAEAEASEDEDEIDWEEG